MPNLSPNQNAPVSAATVVAAVGLLLAAFTTLSAQQVTAVNAAVGIFAAVLVQRFGTVPR